MILTDRPEQELLICCAHANTCPDIDARIQDLVRNGIDWTLLSSLADRHRMIPLVYRELSRLAPEVLREAPLQYLAGRFFAIAALNLKLSVELSQLLKQFESNGIVAIPLKGPLLAVSAFGALCWREFTDLDVLVKPSDISKSKALLESLGFRLEVQLNRMQELAYLREEHAFPYIRDSDNLIVELHWRLYDRYLCFPLDADGLWDSLSPTQFSPGSVLAMSPEYLFLYLCVHGAKHQWERLEWICCLPAVIRANPNLHWPNVIESARRLGGMRLLHLGLLLAQSLDGTEATERPLDLLNRDAIATELAAVVWKNLFVERVQSPQAEVYPYRFYLKSRERLRDRISIVRRAAMRILPPDPSTTKHVPIPSWLLLLLHFLIGPVRRLRKYGLRGVKDILKPKQISL